MIVKLVFELDDVAAALKLSPEEFSRRRPLLEAHGFPRPVAGLDDRWSIIEVVRWVNREPDNFAPPLPASARRVVSRSAQ